MVRAYKVLLFWGKVWFLPFPKAQKGGGEGMTTKRNLYVIKIQHKFTEGEDYVVTTIEESGRIISQRTDTTKAAMDFIRKFVRVPKVKKKAGGKA